MARSELTHTQRTAHTRTIYMAARVHSAAHLSSIVVKQRINIIAAAVRDVRPAIDLNGPMPMHTKLRIMILAHRGPVRARINKMKNYCFVIHLSKCVCSLHGSCTFSV